MKENALYQEFLKENPLLGILRVQVYMANQAIPIVGASILVQKKIENQTFPIYEGKTDESGIIDEIKLPAPNIMDTETPNYTTYTLIVEHPSYQGPITFLVPIYSNQKMIQYVNLIPLYKGDDDG